MGRAPCCEKVGLKKGKWTAEEDDILTKYIQANGNREGSWRSLPKKAGLLRCGKSCRLRWVNYLKTDLKRGNITAEEEDTIIKLHASFGKRWSLIASHLPGRTDNELKNHWNTHLCKKIHTFQGPAGEALPTLVGVDGASVTTKKKAAKTRRCATKKNKSYNKKDGNISTQSPEENVSIDDSDNNVSAQGTEENATVDDGSVSTGRPEEIQLPATPTQEKETLPSTVLTERCMDLDPVVEEEQMMDPFVNSSCQETRLVGCSGEETTINKSMLSLCPGGVKKETEVVEPLEGINGEMLCFNDIIDPVPLDLNEVWSLLEESENCVANIIEERDIGTLMSTNTTAKSPDELENASYLSTDGESVACSSITSFFDDDYNFYWDWESVVRGHHDNQQCDEEENILTSLWECDNVDERKKSQI